MSERKIKNETKGVVVPDVFRVIIKRIGIDTLTNMPVIMLGEENKDYVLPIWIGFAEASSMIIALNKHSLARPLTHDLLVNMLKDLKTMIKKVTITGLKEDTQSSTYLAEILLKKGKKEYVFDARPSDSIALALRVKCPIYMVRTLQSKMIQLSQLKEKFKSDTLKEFLKGLDDKDFGKYKV